MSNDLLKMIEAVAAGEIAPNAFCPLFHESGLCVEAENAFHGSVDAAIALCEVLLPGWAIASMAAWPGKLCTAALFGTHESRGRRCHDFSDGRVYEEGPTIARALLLAALRAKLMETENE